MNKIDEMLKNGSHYTAYITPSRSKRKESVLDKIRNIVEVFVGI
nr:hypothetical protein [Treponema denticola]